MKFSNIFLTLVTTGCLAIAPMKASLPLPDKSAFATPVRRPVNLNDTVSFLRQLFALHDDVAIVANNWHTAPLEIIDMTYRHLFEVEFQVAQDNQWHDLVDWALAHVNNTPRPAFQRHLVIHIIRHRLLQNLELPQLHAIIADITIPEPLRRWAASILAQQAPTRKRLGTFTEFNETLRRRHFKDDDNDGDDTSTPPSLLLPAPLESMF